MQYQPLGPCSLDDSLVGLQPDEVQEPAYLISGGVNDDSDTLHAPISRERRGFKESVLFGHVLFTISMISYHCLS